MKRRRGRRKKRRRDWRERGLKRKEEKAWMVDQLVRVMVAVVWSHQSGRTYQLISRNLMSNSLENLGECSAVIYGHRLMTKTSVPLSPSPQCHLDHRASNHTRAMLRAIQCQRRCTKRWLLKRIALTHCMLPSPSITASSGSNLEQWPFIEMYV